MFMFMMWFLDKAIVAVITNYVAPPLVVGGIVDDTIFLLFIVGRLVAVVSVAFYDKQFYFISDFILLF